MKLKPADGQPTSNGLQPTTDGLQPTSDGLQPPSDGLQPIPMASNLVDHASGHTLVSKIKPRMSQYSSCGVRFQEEFKFAK